MLKKAWTVSKDENGYPVYREGVKYLQVSTDEVYGSLSKDYGTAIDLVIDDEEVKKVVKNRTNLKNFTEKIFSQKKLHLTQEAHIQLPKRVPTIS